MSPEPKLQARLQTDQRLALLGRLRMAEWIEMPEREFAKQVGEIEQDPLFQKLFCGPTSQARVIRRQRWPGGRASAGMFEMNEALLAGGDRVRVEERLAEREELLPHLRRMGQQAFERYYLSGDDGLPLAEVAKRTGVPEETATAIFNMILEIGAESEFAGPAPGPGPSRASTCLAQLSFDGDRPEFEFFSAHWARGMYQIRYDLLEEWKRRGELSGPERRRLRHLLKRLEIINLRQNTIFRILESVAQLQADYLRTRREDRKRPISLRMLARRLSLAPSTVSRALSCRTVRLPWGPELPLIQFVPGRRNVLREVLSRWLAEGKPPTDAVLAERLRKDYGIAVSRRTVNAVRNELLRRSP